MTIPQVRFRAIDGVRIRYADGGSSAEVRPTVLDSITGSRS